MVLYGRDRLHHAVKRLRAGLRFLEGIGPSCAGSDRRLATDVGRVFNLRNFGAHGAAHGKRLVLDRALALWLVRSLATALDGFWAQRRRRAPAPALCPGRDHPALHQRRAALCPRRTAPPRQWSHAWCGARSRSSLASPVLGGPAPLICAETPGQRGSVDWLSGVHLPRGGVAAPNRSRGQGGAPAATRGQTTLAPATGRRMLAGQGGVVHAQRTPLTSWPRWW
jgi:hypothetical protein